MFDLFRPAFRQQLVLISVPMLMSVLMACRKETGGEDHGNEFITTVELQLNRESDGMVTSYAWRDLDGPGGRDPEIEAILLKGGERYQVAVRFLNELGQFTVDHTD